MTTFGNTGASSLMRTATSSLNKIDAYNDAIAAATYDASAKTQADYNTYSTYLNGRVTSVQNTDPAKALTLSNTLRSAQSSFNSAQVQQAQMNIDYGSGTLDDKYNTLSNLRNQALANGDYNQAQSLESEMATTDIARQNAATTAANASDAATTKAQTASKAGVDQMLNNFDSAAKLAKAQVTSGRMTTQQYEAGLAKLNTSKAQLLQDAGNGQHGVSVDAANGYQKQFNDFTTTDDYTKSIAAYPDANSGISSQYLKIDPAMKNPDGSYAGTLADRPAGVTQEVKMPDGSIGYTHAYGGGWQGDETQAKRVTDVGKGTPYIFGQVGRDLTGKQTTPVNQVGGGVITDAKGNNYVVDQNGDKHYVTTDPNSVLQRSQTPIDPNAQPYGPASDTGQVWSGIGQDLTHPLAALSRDVSSTTKTLGTGFGILGNIPSDLSPTLKAASNILSGKQSRSPIESAVGSAIKGGGSMLARLFAGNDQAVQAQKLAAVQKQAADAEAARVNLYNQNVAAGKLAVATPAMVAAKTPNISVKPIMPTPSVAVTNKQVGINALPSLKVSAPAPTPSIKVVGPAYQAPAPSGNILSNAFNAVKSWL